MKEVRDISQIDYGNRITIKNPADEEFCLNIKKNTNARICVGRAGTGYRTENYLRYLADHAGGDPGKAGLCPGTGNCFLWMARRRLCAVRDAFVYCRSDVFSYGSVPGTGVHENHHDGAYHEAAYGLY